MKALNDIITISTLSVTSSSGDASESWSAPVTVRANVMQIDGSRNVQGEELTDKVVYRIECYDNNYSGNIRIVYNGLTLYPVKPITKNKGKSLLNEIVIIASTKE